MSVTLHTSLGPIKLEIFCDLVPRTSFNFLSLLTSGAYDSTEFHRNIPSFMVQAGSPSGKTKGGKSIWGEYFPDEFHPSLKHNQRGILSMANKGPNTNSSQFFITYERAPHLNNVYTIFGQVISGWDTLDAIERQPTGEKDRPVNRIVLERWEVHANPLADEGIVYEGVTGPPTIT
ncbi:hypothetical protein TrVE_jg13096 [Triparma verrucosa]|uniref:Peptidyl-prolyl cis-trans isomerase n=2 Tax=Triparma TaxID=722752 RepID=A0A9W6ZWG6_9STRA|nr:hypothetical protein TrST_g13001 [Triparma strigata]GMH89453.1 hypothetical protein TrVE_jg13096 [Triparma verrucosa]